MRIKSSQSPKSKRSIGWPLLFAILSVYAYGQEQSLINVSSGTELQGGIGNFGDPTMHHGLALTMNGAIGSSSAPNVFSYDAFSINGRWVPGTNSIGRRIGITFGAANWFNPALSTIYKDSALTDEERVSSSKTTSFMMAGLVFQILKSNRVPNSTEYAAFNTLRQPLLLAYANAQNAIEKETALQDLAKFNWENVIRAKMRQPCWIVGGNFRLGNLSTETTIDVVDMYTTFSVGKKLFDFSTSLRYIKSLDRSLILNDAYTASAGFFVDLDDLPPVNTMGLILGIGQYNYLGKERTYTSPSKTVMVSDSPKSIRYDVTLSFSNLFGETGAFGSGIGFRYSYLDHKSAKTESQFALLFTSKFINTKK